MANAIDDVEAVKQTINTALESISERAGFGPREQYKALRGLAFQAFGQMIESGDFKQLVKDAQLNAKHLPRGWGMTAQADASNDADDVEDEKAAPKKPTARKPKTKPAAPSVEDAVKDEKAAPRRRRRPAAA